MGWVSIAGGDVNPRPPYTPPGGGGGTGLFPNQPVAYTQFENNSWDVAPATFPTLNASGWMNRDAADQPNLSIITDATAPASPSNILQGKLPLNWGGGVSTYAIWRPFNTSTEYFPKMYVGLYIKVSSNFTNNGNTGTKFMWPVGNDVDPNFNNDNYSGFDGTNLEYQFFQQNTVIRRMGANVGLATNAQFDTKLGTWHSLEFIVEANSSAGTADGKLTCWIDNVLTHQYTDVNWVMSGTPRKWTGLRQEDTYGGGTNPEPADMFFWTDHLRIAGSN